MSAVIIYMYLDFVAVLSRGSFNSKGKSVVSEDALLAAGLYSAAVSNATYVLSTRGFCREMIKV